MAVMQQYANLRPSVEESRCGSVIILIIIINNDSDLHTIYYAWKTTCNNYYYVKLLRQTFNGNLKVHVTGQVRSESQALGQCRFQIYCHHHLASWLITSLPHDVIWPRAKCFSFHKNMQRPVEYFFHPSIIPPLKLFQTQNISIPFKDYVSWLEDTLTSKELIRCGSPAAATPRMVHKELSLKTTSSFKSHWAPGLYSPNFYRCGGHVEDSFRICGDWNNLCPTRSF